MRTLAVATVVTFAVMAAPAAAAPFDTGKLTAGELDTIRAGRTATLLSRTDVMRIVQEEAQAAPIRAGSGGVTVIQRNTGRNARLSSSITIEIRNRGGDVQLGGGQ